MSKVLCSRRTMMQFKKTTAAMVAAAILAVGAGGGLSAATLLNANGMPAATPVNATVAPGPIPLGTAPNYRAIVVQSGPAVVGITTENEVKVSEGRGFSSGPFGGDNGAPSDDPFYQFFRQLPIPHGN